MGKVVEGLLGTVGLGGAAKAPKVSGAAAREVGINTKKSRRRRSSLFETEGGVAGQELSPTQITKRDTIFGN